jgi:hypothetical protein
MRENVKVLLAENDGRDAVLLGPAAPPAAPAATATAEGAK